MVRRQVVRLWIVVVVLVAGCVSTDLQPSAPTTIPIERDKRVLQHFVIDGAPEELLWELSEGELSFESLGERDLLTQRRTIRLFATEDFVAKLAEKFDVTAKLDRYWGPLRGPVNSNCSAYVPDRGAGTSDFIWSYADVEQLVADSVIAGAAEARVLGRSVLGRDLWAIKFGPLDHAQGAPTVYVVATQHAREWAAAGVAVSLIKELTQTILDNTYTLRPSLHRALEHAAIVIVPVANPDGYEHSRSVDRLWRGNLEISNCSTGVDLNRNHSATWGVPGGSTPICGQTFRGTGAASEPEAAAIDEMLRGSSFELTETPIAVIDYHTFSDLVIYPTGFKPVADRDGPACNDYLSTNCQNADFQALRDLFGDTTSHRASPPLFVELPAVGPLIPFRRDMAPNILYHSSGSLLDQGAYSPVSPMLSATVELTSGMAFAIECNPAHDQIVKDAAFRQLDVLERLLIHGANLASTDRATAYFPNNVGSLASGVLTREYSVGVDPKDRRGFFTKPVWKAIDTGELSGTFDGLPVTFDPLRKGVHYSLYGVASQDPLCAPCEVVSEIADSDVSGADRAPECTKCVDLCEPSRLSPSNGMWELVSENRGSSPDCWWKPTGVGNLIVPQTWAPFFATKCTFSFSFLAENPGLLNYNALRLIRDSPAGSEVVWTTKQTAPYITWVPDKLTTLTFEASELLPSGRVPWFMFEAVDSSVAAAGIHIFDPIVYCRIGSIQ